MDRRHRIRRSYEFRRVRQQGRCWSTDLLVLCVLPTGAAETRYGFVVNKRLGGAVIRNRVKRCLREAARRLAPNVEPGYDVVVIARGAVASHTSVELANILAVLLRRARIHRPADAQISPAQPPSPPQGRQTEIPTRSQEQ